MTSLKNAVDRIYKENWTLTTNFLVHFSPNEKSKKLWEKCNMPAEDVNIYLKDFTIPQIGQSTLIEEFINDRMRFTQGYFDPFTFELTFKDHDSFELYRAFTKYLIYSKNTYLENYAFSMTLYKLKDFQNDKETFEFMRFEKCAITHVSAVTLSNETESQIAEIGVNIKCSEYPVICGQKISEGNTYLDIIKG